MPRRPSRRRAVAVVVPLLVAGVSLAACGDDAPTAEGYCGLLEANLAALNAPTVVTDLDVEAAVELYADLADAAPVAVRAEWQTLATAVETASTVVPTDPASVQMAADTARAAEPAARTIAEHAGTTCGMSLGITPQPTAPPSTEQP